MTIQSDHKALIFVAAVAVLGVGVRVVRAAGRDGAPAVQPALARQAQASDSSAHAARSGASGAKGRGRKAASSAVDDTTRRAAVRDSIKRANAGPLDRAGYINGKLDLDVATAAQIDSLPGVSPLMARRIVLDRMSRGPFLSLDGLRRVSGAGPAFVAQIGALVVFSGTVTYPNAKDTIIPRRVPKRFAPPAKPPV